MCFRQHIFRVGHPVFWFCTCQLDITEESSLLFPECRTTAEPGGKETGLNPITVIIYACNGTITAKATETYLSRRMAIYIYGDGEDFTKSYVTRRKAAEKGRPTLLPW
jgi:hypothetical protein